MFKISLIVIFIFSFLIADDYQDWLKSQNTEYSQYKKSMDEEFSTMLKKDWEEFQSMSTPSPYKKPKPIVCQKLLNLSRLLTKR